MVEEFRIPVVRFVKGLKGTKDEVWTKLLTLQYATQAKTASEWKEIMTRLKGAKDAQS